MPLKDYDKKLPKTSDSKALASSTAIESEEDEVQPTKKLRPNDSQLSSNSGDLSDPNSSTNNTPQKQADTSTSGSKKNRKRNRKGKKVDNKPQSSNPTGNRPPVEFDYSKVDFKKFQGGSQKPQQPLDIKTKFMGKVNLLYWTLDRMIIYSFSFFHLQGKNNKANKQFNKLFSFSNSNKKK